MAELARGKWQLVSALPVPACDFDHGSLTSCAMVCTHPRWSDQHLGAQRARLGDWLTNAEEGCEYDALPPPIRQPEEAAGEGGLPGRRQGDEACEVAGDEGLDRCAEGEE